MEIKEILLERGMHGSIGNREMLIISCIGIVILISVCIVARLESRLNVNN